MSLSPFQLAALKQASHDVLAEATAFLQALIRIDTTNPPGLNYREIATLIADHLSTLDYETQLLAVDKAGAQSVEITRQRVGRWRPTAEKNGWVLTVSF